MPFVKNIESDYGAVGNGVTNDRPAFMSWHDAAQGQDAVLNLGTSKTYLMGDSAHPAAALPFSGCNSLIINFNGSTLKSNGSTGYFHLGNTILPQDNQHSARLQTVSPGAGTVQVKTGTQTNVNAYADNGSNKVRMTVDSTVGFTTGETVMLLGVIPNYICGWRQITVVDGTHMDLVTTAVQFDYDAQHDSFGADFTNATVNKPMPMFSNGAPVVVTGFDNQGHGFPQNPAYWDFANITSIAGTTITLDGPLTYNYLDTWPVHNSGTSLGDADNGGPATLYTMDSTWPHPVTFVGPGTIDQTNSGALSNIAMECGANTVLFTDITVAGVGGSQGLFPTGVKDWTMDGLQMPDGSMEVDKLIDNMSITNGSTVNGIAFQSGSVKNFLLENSTITFSIVGTVKKNIIRNSTVGTLSVGPYVYGRCDELIVEDSIISDFKGFDPHGLYIAGGDGNNNGAQVDFSMNHGVITVPRSFSAFGTRWAVPGNFIFLLDDSVGLVCGFNVIALTFDATNCYVQTDYPYADWPARSWNLGKMRMWVHPCKRATFTRVTGCQDVLDLCRAPARRPLHSYFIRDFTGSVASTGFIGLYGRVMRYNFTVHQPYSGATGTVEAQILANYVKTTDPAADVSYAPTFNLKQMGVRSLDLSSGVAAWTGGKSGDTLPTPTDPLWLCSLFRMSMTDITAQNPGTWPTFTIEAITEHGLTDDAQVHFRYHKK